MARTSFPLSITLQVSANLAVLATFLSALHSVKPASDKWKETRAVVPFQLCKTLRCALMLCKTYESRKAVIARTFHLRRFQLHET